MLFMYISQGTLYPRHEITTSDVFYAMRAARALAPVIMRSSKAPAWAARLYQRIHKIDKNVKKRARKELRQLRRQSKQMLRAKAKGGNALAGLLSGINFLQKLSRWLRLS